MFALIHNNQIKVGPRQWNHRFFKDYLEENNIDESLIPIKEPIEPIITENYKILKVTEIKYPDQIDSLTEQLAGPYWTIHDDFITGEYQKANIPIDSIKNTMKSIITSNRYEVEVMGVDYTLPDSTVVTLHTDRDGRRGYLDSLVVLNDEEEVSFKFKNEVFKTISKETLKNMVRVGGLHVANAFIWEDNKHQEIDNCADIIALKSIELKHELQQQETQEPEINN